MMLFRNKRFIRIFSLFTGVIFLNMGFFLAEVNMLGIKDKQMIENVAKLVLNGGLEEERDAHGSGADVSAKVFSMAADLLLRHSSLFLIAAKIHGDNEDHYLHADHSEIISPPPEFHISFS